nr:tRNA lysidine(34) synthetase TilS [Acholeplasmatales bacterium]
MENKVKEFIKNNNLILNKPIIVAVSGGADSVSLLYVLHKLGYKLVLAHVNHNKRKESIIEQHAMEELALKLNIPFELLDYHYSSKDNFQSEAHEARYEFFKSLCKKYNTNIIATAHHKDDQIETVLMKLMEGSNLYGYGGIAISNVRDGYLIIRPLLCVTKEEIYDYCNKNNLVYFEDSSNKENDYLRNRLRHNVIPILKNECPSLGDKIMEYSIQAHEAFDYIREQSISYLKNNNDTIDINTYLNLNIALKKDIL